MSVDQGISYVIRMAAEGGRQVSAELKQVGENGEKSFKKLGGAVDMTSVRLAQVAKIASRSALALAAAAGAAVTLGLRQMAVIDQNAKMARSFNITNEEMAAMGLVAAEGGSSLERLVSAMSPLQEKIAKAANGNKAWREEFDRLGISIDDLLKMSPAEQFAEVAEALAEVENTTLRNGIAAKIFGGDVGRELIPMLDDYKAKVTEAAEFNRRFNISLSDIDAAKVEEANDAWARAKSIVTGLGNTIAVGLAPIITAVSNLLIDAGVDGKAFGEAVRYGMGLAATAMDIVRVGILGIRISINSVIFGVTSLVAKVTDDLATLDEGIAKTISKIPGITVEADGKMRALADGFKKSAKESADEVKRLADELVNFESTSSKINRINAEAEERARKSGGRVMPTIAGIAIDPAAAEEAKKLAKETKKAGDAAKEAQRNFDSMVDGIIDDLKRGEFSLERFADFAVEQLKIVLSAKNKAGTGTVGGDLAGDVFGGLFSGIGGFFKGIFGFEQGGVMTGRGPLPLKTYSMGGIANSPQLAMYGEGRRPEAYVPLPDGRTIPVTMTGGGLNVIINNNANVAVRAQPVRNSGPVKEFRIEIDEIAASLASDPGSRFSRALAGRNKL